MDSFGLILKKTFKSTIFREIRIRFTLFLLINGQTVQKSYNFGELPITIISRPSMLET